MTRYTARRILLLFPTLLAVYTITFFLIHAIPGSPFDTGDKTSEETIKRLAHAYGTDQPLYRQYLTTLWNIIHGQFGPSFVQSNRDVSDIIGNFFPVSIQLGILAMILAVIMGLVFGVMGAVRQNSLADYFSTFGAIVGVSTPSYVVASLLILLFANTLHLLPTGGWNGMFSKDAFIPAFALALAPAATLARYTRSSLLEVLRQDYIRTARAKGLDDRTAIVRHALRNALIPVVTVMGLSFANVITGSFFIEVTCNVPGLGRYFVTSISGRDYPVVFGTVLLFAAVIAVVNLVVDVLYGVLDPRIAYE